MTAAPGWYDDPLVPGGMRYWDGANWTEAVQLPPPPLPPPPGAAIGPSLGGAPPFEPLPAEAAATGDRFNDIGEWLNRTFRVLRDQLGPVALLFVAVPYGLFVPAYLALHLAVADVRWFVDDGRVDGLDPGLAVAGIVLIVIAVGAATVGYLGGHHHLYRAHLVDGGGGDQWRPEWHHSLRVGLVRLPRFVGAALVAYGAIAVAAATPIALLVAIVIWEPASIGLYVLAAIALALATAVFLVWCWVKVAFLPVSAVVVPSGTSAIASSWRVSAGRFWPLLARLAILFALTATVSTVAQIIGQTMAPVVLFSQFEVDAAGDLLLDGRAVDTIEILRLGDALPNPFVAVLYFAVVSVAGAAVQAVSASALTALFADAEARDGFGHGAGS